MAHEFEVDKNAGLTSRERERACAYFRLSNIVSFMHIDHTISSFVSRNGIKIVMAHEFEVDKKVGLTPTDIRERERARVF